VALSPDLLAGLIGFLITVLVFSYVVGDNPLFRVAAAVFVGVSAGYIAAVAFWQALWPHLVQPLLFGDLGERLSLLVPLAGAGLIMTKVVPQLRRVGSPAVAFLAGVSAAVVMAGAVQGTILPQALATIGLFDLRATAARGTGILAVLWNGSLILMGTVTSLAYFHFGARPATDGSLKRHLLIEATAGVGRVFIAITLGVIFAGVYAAALTALIERLDSILIFLRFS
jgi:hypothetical protein